MIKAQIFSSSAFFYQLIVRQFSIRLLLDGASKKINAIVIAEHHLITVLSQGECL